MDSDPTARVLAEVATERARQSHDRLLGLDFTDLCELLAVHCKWLPYPQQGDTRVRQRLLTVAALAVAAVERLDQEAGE